MLLPTRGRAALARRFLDSVVRRAANPEAVEVVIYADEDDPQSHGITADGLRVNTLVGPRVSMGNCNASCLEKSSGEIVILANDDVIIQTPGWDLKVCEAHQSVPDGIYLAYPNDLFKGRRVCTFPILSRLVCTLLGEPFPRAYRGAFIDYHLLDIFRRLEYMGHSRLIYLADVVFEHMHPRAGKGKTDRVYLDRDRFGDDDTFLALRDERSRLATRLASNASSGLGGIVSHGARWSGGVPAGPGILRATLLDPELPLTWRLRLFFWFVARRAARRIL
jgi:hypothetical protein